MEDILVLDKISKKYKNILANECISLAVLPRNITALVGHNGAGKTTLLAQIGGLVKSDSGSIFFKDVNLLEKPAFARKMVASMPQFQVPLQGVSLQQAIVSIARIRGFSQYEAKNKAHELIAYLQLEKYKDLSGDKLSGGLQRLTSFAMTVVSDAPIMIFDEPTNDVDPVRRVLMWKYLRKLADDGAIVIVVSHNLLEVEKYADRYVVLDGGKVKTDSLISSHLTSDIKHQLMIYGVDNQCYERLSCYSTTYHANDKKLSIVLSSEQLPEIILILVDLLEKGCLTHYELKIVNLFESYEEMLT